MATPINNLSSKPGKPIDLTEIKELSEKLNDLEKRVDKIRPFPINEAWSKRINRLGNISLGAVLTISVLWAAKCCFLRH